MAHSHKVGTPHGRRSHKSKVQPKHQIRKPPSPVGVWFRKKSVRIVGLGAALLTAGSIGWVFYQAHMFDSRHMGKGLVTMNSATGEIRPGGRPSVIEKAKMYTHIHAADKLFERHLEAFFQFLSTPEARAELGKLWEQDSEARGIITFRDGVFLIERGTHLSEASRLENRLIEGDNNFFFNVNLRLQTLGLGFAIDLPGTGNAIYGMLTPPDNIKTLLSQYSQNVPTQQIPHLTIILDRSNTPLKLMFGETAEGIRDLTRLYGVKAVPTFDPNANYVILVGPTDEIKGFLEKMLPELEKNSVLNAMDSNGFTPNFFSRFHTHHKQLELLPVEEDCQVDIANTAAHPPGIVFRMFPDGSCEAVATWKETSRVLGRFIVHAPMPDSTVK